MKKQMLTLMGCMAIAAAFTSCGGNKKQQAATEEEAATTAEATIDLAVSTQPMGEENKTISLPVNSEGVITIFDGTSAEGWRGYGKDSIPARWTVDEGTLKINGSGTGEGQSLEGGDLIFAHKFKNFELTLEWKVDKGSNSGIFYLAQEVPVKDKPGQFQPIYISAPEYQVLDNANHPDAKLGKDGNRQSASLYDMIPADPQNSKPFGEWNEAKILVYKGTIVHYQNGEKVLEYHLWTPKWTEMLQASKFSEKAWPEAFALLNNCGGDNHEGFIGLQDHGDNVWFRNIKVKVLDN